MVEKISTEQCSNLGPLDQQVQIVRLELVQQVLVKLKPEPTCIYMYSFTLNFL